MLYFLRYQFQNLPFYFWVLLYLSCLCVTLLNIFAKDGVLNFIVALLGICYAFFAGMGKSICFLIGILYCLFAIILAYQTSLYAELVLNIFYIPINLAGLLLWNKYQDLEKKTLIIKKLPFKKILFCIFIILSLTLIYGKINTYFNAQFAFLNSLTTILQIVAFFLQIYRYAQHYLFVTLSNIIMLYIWLELSLDNPKYIFQIFNTFIFLIIGIYYAIKWHQETQCKQ